MILPYPSVALGPVWLQVRLRRLGCLLGVAEERIGLVRGRSLRSWVGRHQEGEVVVEEEEEEEDDDDNGGWRMA